MKRACTILVVLAFTWIASALTAPAHGQLKATGTVQGRATDVDGVALPGVGITVSGEMARGEQTVFTGVDGRYRIPLLSPGEYVLTFRLRGFATVVREEVEVGVQRNTTVNVFMQLSPVDETITVTGKSPLVDIKSTKRSSEYSDDLRNVLPESRGTGFDLINLAPEATPDAASTNASGDYFFGDYSTAFLVDGVNVTDPATGTQFPFYSPDWFDVVELTSLGGNAEFGKYQGVAFNVVTKSGGNTYHGETNYFFQNDSFYADNTAGIKEEYDESFESPALEYRHDFSFSIGGPLMRDQLWFFASYQGLYESEQFSGVNYLTTTDADRFFGKITWQADQNDRLTGSIMADTYTSDGNPSRPLRDWESTYLEPSFNMTPNVTWNRILSSDTFLEIKYSGFYGYFDAVPLSSIPSTFDEGYWYYYGGFYGPIARDRSRTNIQGSLTHYAEDLAGNHSFKFGAEWERGTIQTSQQYNANVTTLTVMGETFEPGTLGIYYVAYLGQPYLAYITQPNLNQGSSVQTPLTFYAQDDWTVADRFTLNLGLRFDHWVMGYTDGVTIPNSPVFNDLAPRIGVNFDVFSDGTTSLNAFYGRFYEGVHGYVLDDFDPRRATEYWLEWDGAGYQEWNSVDPLTDIGIDPDLRNQYSDQFVFGLDRQITETLSFTGRYIYKKGHDAYGGQDIRTHFEPVQAETAYGDTITVYNAPGGYDRFRLLTNNPWEELFGQSFREYKGVQVKAVRRLADNWSLIASLLIQKSTGNIHDWAMYWGSLGSRDDPNDFVGTPGWMSTSRTYVSKIQGSYRVPAPVDTQLGFIINWMSGGRQTPVERIWDFQEDGQNFPFGQRYVQVPIAQRGSYVKESQFRLDLRADKIFQLGGGWGDLGVILDIFNVFNDDTISNIYNRVDRDNFGDPSAIILPRIWRLGVRWIF